MSALTLTLPPRQITCKAPAQDVVDAFCKTLHEHGKARMGVLHTRRGRRRTAVVPHTNGTSHSTSAGAPWQRQPTHRRHRAGIVLSSTLTPQGSAVHAAELTGTYVAIVAKQ